MSTCWGEVLFSGEGLRTSSRKPRFRTQGLEIIILFVRRLFWGVWGDASAGQAPGLSRRTEWSRRALAL
eukprot:11299771-Alexandrium_andersonii.AAC.1